MQRTYSIERDPLESLISLEDTKALVEKAQSSWEKFERVFFPENELEIFIAHKYTGAPIRFLAIKHHMSRYNIRKRIFEVEKKIKALRSLFS